MCGIFAYAGVTAPDPELLRAAAAGATARGPHGWGFASLEGIHRRLGPARLEDLKLVERSTTILGHARLATFGAHDDEQGLQPIVVRDWKTMHTHLVAHNGNCYNAEELYPLALDQAPLPSDSWHLAYRYAQLRATIDQPGQAFGTLLAEAHMDAFALVIIDGPTGTLMAARRRLPLHQLLLDDAAYWSSRPLPGSHPLAEGRMYLHLTGQALEDAVKARAQT
jgi:asparagine synthetase B (glutamine-hydrolysing)